MSEYSEERGGINGANETTFFIQKVYTKYFTTKHLYSGIIITVIK